MNEISHGNITLSNIIRIIMNLKRGVPQTTRNVYKRTKFTGGGNSTT